MNPREWWRRAWAFLHRGALERELTAELEDHVSRIAADLEHGGVAADQARRQARRTVGSQLRAREASRESWGFPRLEQVLSDVRYAARGLVRSPGFTATAVVTLALGVGANVAMFAMIDRLMFRPFPYTHDPSHVHAVYLQTTYNGRVSTGRDLAYARYLDLVANTHTFSNWAAVSEWRLAVGRGANTRVDHVEGVSASLFTFFDAPPAAGRYFTAAEDRTPSGTPVVVLSHDLWQTEFGGRDMLGQRLHIGSADFTVIGVAPQGFVGMGLGVGPDLFIPITTVPALIQPSAQHDYFTTYGWTWVSAIVRTKPGVSAAATSADLSAAYSRSRAIARVANPRVLPDSIAHPHGIAGPLRDAAGPDPGLQTRVLLWVFGVAAIVLLIACANVANLMLARAFRRSREIALRVALGVSRTRLASQFFAEGLALAALGLVAGVFVAQAAGGAIRATLLTENTPEGRMLGPTFNLLTDWRALGAASLIALMVVLLISVGPATLATRPNLAARMKAGAREGTEHHRSATRTGLLVAQAALSVMLLVGAALFVQSLRNVLAIHLGYDASAVVNVYPDFRGLAADSSTRVSELRRLLDVAKSLPGVDAAARVNANLFATNTLDLAVPGIDSVSRLGRFDVQVTTPDYFRVMRTRIVRGRGLSEQDRAHTPLVAVVSQSMGRVLWPAVDPIGKCMYVKWNGAPKGTLGSIPCTTVVGVAEDVAAENLLDDQRFLYYLPVEQTMPAGASNIYVRLAGQDGAGGAELVRRAMQAAMPGDGFVVVRPLQDVLDNSRFSWQIGAALFLAFGVLALLVAAVGLYGVIAYDVAQRRHEIGVRMAIGARAADVVAMVVRQGATLVACGVFIGLALAAVGGRWIQPLLYRESPRDPIAYGCIGLIVLGVALVSSAIPAKRAASIDAASALRID